MGKPPESHRIETVGSADESGRSPESYKTETTNLANKSGCPPEYCTGENADLADNTGVPPKSQELKTICETNGREVGMRLRVMSHC